MDDDSLNLAVTRTFAYVACSDGELAPSERERFVGWAGAEEAVSGGPEQLAATFDAFAVELSEDFLAAEARYLESLRAARPRPEQRELIVRSAQVAIVADERLEAVEEAALFKVCAALGVDPSAV